MAKKKSYTRDFMLLGDNPASAVRRGQEIDRMNAAHRAFMAENARLRAADDARRVAIENARSPSMTAGGPSRIDPNLISDALARATLGGLGLASFAMPLRAGLALGAGSEAAALGGTEDAAFPGALAALGVAGRAALPVLGAAGAAYAADADAALTPGRRLMHLINNEGFKDLRPAREFYWPHQGTEPVGSTAFDDPRVASRLLVDVPGANLVPVHRRSTRAGLFNQIDENGNLRVDDVDGVRTGFAGGGSAIRKGLEKFGRRAARGEFDETAEAPMGALSIVKQKGGSWLSGSVEDALAGLKRQRPNWTGPELPPDPINQWIEGPLTKYVKTRMASPDDEVRRLAEQGVLHFEPVPVGSGNTMLLMGKRAVAGFNPSGIGKNELGRAWEDVTDQAVRIDPNTNFPGQMEYSLSGGLADRAHHLQSSAGFSHLIDELSNALNPNSGLPRNLQLTPEAMANLSMEKAVRRVADINAWRAEQIAKARLESMAGRPVIRDYTENNPKGLRWVQLKREGDFAAESDAMGHSVRGYEPPERGGHLHYGFGGWPAIQRDKARVFSLQDAKGEPHVTVEIGRGLGLGTRYDSATHYVQDPKKWDSWMNSIGGYDGFKKFIKSRDPSFDFRKNNGTTMDILVKVAPDVVGEVGAVELPWYINQIKGKQNRAPNEEYLPFVQDFVRNNPLGGQWVDVGDLQNTGLTKHQSGKYVSDAEANALARRHFGDVNFGNKPDAVENPWQYANRIRRYDPDMLSDTDKAFLADWEAGNFAQGGPVTQSSPADTARATIPASWETLFPQGAM